VTHVSPKRGILPRYQNPSAGGPGVIQQLGTLPAAPPA
jgi:hypothetical protein